MTNRAALIFIVMAALFSGPAFAGAVCTTAGLDFSVDDIERLDHLSTSRENGLVGALRAESLADRTLVADLFSQSPKNVKPEQLVGAYQCRTIKLGGLLPLNVYGWFKCEITNNDNGLTLTKTSGSQNFSGTLTASENAFTYRGAQVYSYEEQGRAYGDDPERNQAGCLSVLDIARGHLILELPEPRVESDHNVIEFLRR